MDYQLDRAGPMTTEGSTGYSLGGPTTQGPTGYPIGYWIKRLDRAIEGALDPTLAAEDLTRRHWQTMNFLHAGPSDARALAEALRPFWGQGAITLDEVLCDLQRLAVETAQDLIPRDRTLTPERPQPLGHGNPPTDTRAKASLTRATSRD